MIGKNKFYVATIRPIFRIELWKNPRNLAELGWPDCKVAFEENGNHSCNLFDCVQGGPPKLSHLEYCKCDNFGGPPCRSVDGNPDIEKGHCALGKSFGCRLT